MNAAKFDRITFENLQKYPNHTIDFFMQKFDFKDEKDFIDNLERIYGSGKKAQSIVKEMKKKEEKAKKREEKKAIKSRRANMKNAQKDIADANVSVDNTTMEHPNETDNNNSESNNTERVEDMNNNEIQVNEDISKKEKIEVCTVSTGEAADLTDNTEISELYNLKSKLEKNENLITEIISDITNKTELCSTFLKNIEACSEKVKQIQEELEIEKKNAEDNVLKLRETEKAISESIDMKNMVLEEIASLKERIEVLEVTKLYFCNPLIFSKNDIMAYDVEIDTDKIAVKLMEIVYDTILKEMQLPIGMVSELAKNIAIIERSLTSIT